MVGWRVEAMEPKAEWGRRQTRRRGPEFLILSCLKRRNSSFLITLFQNWQLLPEIGLLAEMLVSDTLQFNRRASGGRL